MPEYKNIPGYKYCVSRNGEIINIETGKHKAQHISNSGYWYISLWKDGKSKSCFVHRIVAEAFVPNPNKKPEVNHKDGNKLNNRADNLEWVTGAENKRHCREVLGKINRNPNTEAAHNACKKKVICISTGEKYESVTSAAKAIGVSQGHMSEHLYGKHPSCKGLVFVFEAEARVVNE